MAEESTCPVCLETIPEGAKACPSCGYHLIDATASFSPVNLDEKGFAPSSEQAAPDLEQAPVSEPAVEAQAPEVKLTVIRGPQIGTAFNLSHDEKLSIGRSPKCDIFLNDMTVSRLHASIEPVGASFKIVDENSFNGIWINNDNVTAAMLKNDDIIQIGAFCLLVSM